VVEARIVQNDPESLLLAKLQHDVDDIGFVEIIGENVNA